jgi:Tol biopolymer transport system component
VRFVPSILAAALCLVLTLAGLGQAPADEKAKAKAKAGATLNFHNNATRLTLFDRQGKAVATVGERALFSQNQGAFSPDGTRMAAVRMDLPTQNNDVWVFEIATGAATRISSDRAAEASPVWSPDGRQIAYVSNRGGTPGVYRKNSNGEGAEEILYKHSGTVPLFLTDWSADGRFLLFWTGPEGVMQVLPVEGDRKPIELGRARGGRFSPDGRFVAYRTNPADGNEIHVQQFDSSWKPAGGPWKIWESTGGGLIAWRQDGKELYFGTIDANMMVAEVSLAPVFEARTPKLLFKVTALVFAPAQASSIATPDGQRFVFAMPAPTPRQLTVFDRQGQPVGRIGEPGVYLAAMFSPDGKRVAVLRSDPATSTGNIWVFDTNTGRATRMTSDSDPKNQFAFSPDGRHLAYIVRRGDYSYVLRKAADGAGPEESLYRHTPGAGLGISDWSPDGRFIILTSGGVLYALPLAGDRRLRELVREEYTTQAGQFSPDSRLVAYQSDESKRLEVYLREFDSASGRWTSPPVPTKLSAGLPLVFRNDGKELLTVAFDGSVMAAEVAGAQPGTARVLFQAPPIASPAAISRDGQRFLFALVPEP